MNQPEAKGLRIAWIGTGVMGRSMAGHLQKAGCELRIHTRTRAKAAELEIAGARWCESPAEAAEGADIAVSMVGYPHDVEAAHLGAAGTLAARHRPALIIDMTTSRPSLAREIAQRAGDLGVGSVDAPVSGGDVGAREAALSIMVGGESRAVEAGMPVLQRLGKTIVHHGGPGTGQHAKMVNQILIASGMMGMCEGLLYAQRAGLDGAKVIQSVGSGAAGSWAINNLGPRILRGDFKPGFYVEHFIKDLGIALEEAKAMELTLPGLELATQLYEWVGKKGLGREGTQALYLALSTYNPATAHPRE